MPARDDLRSILVVGSGPIVIGQACEFDYSGTQAIRALRGEGYRVVLVNSNPATIMTDPDLADATYVEPITAEIVAAIIAEEQPDALLPTLGGQTALNVTTELAGLGVLDRHRVELIGAGLDAIAAAEDRGPVQGVDGCGRDRHRTGPVGDLRRGCAHRRRGARLSGDGPPQLHPRGWGHRPRLRSGRVAPGGRRGSRRLPGG